MKKYLTGVFVAVMAAGIASLTLAQTATSTPPVAHSLFRPAELNINPEGRFLAHGMIVESVSGNSFVGKVWGTSWTVNIVSSPELEFLLQNGAGTGQVTLSNVLKPGDEVGVSGTVDQNQALTVNGRVVRDYSLGDMKEFDDRETEMENEHGNMRENSGEGENEQHNQQQGEGENNENGSGSSTNQNAVHSIQQQIQNILDQVKALQEKVNASR